MKYKILEDREHRVGITDYKASTVYRIVALKDFGDVKAGQLGGFVKDYDNLSQEGDCFIYDDAVVYEGARVVGNAKIRNNAEVSGTAIIQDNAQIIDNTEVINGVVMGNAVISGFVKLLHDEVVKRSRKRRR